MSQPFLEQDSFAAPGAVYFHNTIDEQKIAHIKNLFESVLNENRGRIPVSLLEETLLLVVSEWRNVQANVDAHRERTETTFRSGNFKSIEEFLLIVENLCRDVAKATKLQNVTQHRSTPLVKQIRKLQSIPNTTTDWLFNIAMNLESGPVSFSTKLKYIVSDTFIAMWLPLSDDWEGDQDDF